MFNALSTHTHTMTYTFSERLFRMLTIFGDNNNNSRNIYSNNNNNRVTTALTSAAHTHFQICADWGATGNSEYLNKHTELCEKHIKLDGHV